MLFSSYSCVIKICFSEPLWSKKQLNTISNLSFYFKLHESWKNAHQGVALNLRLQKKTLEDFFFLSLLDSYLQISSAMISGLWRKDFKPADWERLGLSPGKWWVPCMVGVLVEIFGCKWRNTWRAGMLLGFWKPAKPECRARKLQIPGSIFFFMFFLSTCLFPFSIS